MTVLTSRLQLMRLQKFHISESLEKKAHESKFMGFLVNFSRLGHSELSKYLP